MWISLRDCSTLDGEKARQLIYDKINRCAGKLVEVAQEIELKYDIPIINKRIAVTPIAQIAEASDEEDFCKFSAILDKAASSTGVDFIGGFSSLVHKGFTKGDKKLINSIPRALAETERICSSVNVATTKAGINMDAVSQMGEVIKKTAALALLNDAVKKEA